MPSCSTHSTLAWYLKLWLRKPKQKGIKFVFKALWVRNKNSSNSCITVRGNNVGTIFSETHATSIANAFATSEVSYWLTIQKVINIARHIFCFEIDWINKHNYQSVKAVYLRENLCHSQRLQRSLVCLHAWDESWDVSVFSSSKY